MKMVIIMYESGRPVASKSSSRSNGVAASRTSVLHKDVTPNALELTDGPVDIANIPDRARVRVDSCIRLLQKCPAQTSFGRTRRTTYEYIWLVSHEFHIDGNASQVGSHREVGSSSCEQNCYSDPVKSTLANCMTGGQVVIVRRAEIGGRNMSAALHKAAVGCA